MAIPISYNIRNLKLRKGLTIMTALGIALTVTTAVFLMALLAGLKKAFMASGDPVNVLVMRKGSVAELSGGFDASLFPTLKTLPGIAQDNKGEPLASGEWVVVVVLPRKDGTGEVNVSVRGLMPAGLTLRPSAKLVEGRWFTPGQREVVVGQSIHNRFSGANVGDDQRLKLEGTLETDYYEKRTSSGGVIKFIGTVVAVIMAIGSSFAAMNTMYAAVAYRSKEIATLRIIGFSRPSILTSFVIEALLLSLLGAAVGIVLILPFNGMSTGIGNQLTFSETVFSLHVTWGVAMTAVIFALIMGLLGGFAPAWHAARQDILTSLRA